VLLALGLALAFSLTGDNGRQAGRATRTAGPRSPANAPTSTAPLDLITTRPASKTTAPATTTATTTAPAPPAAPAPAPPTVAATPEAALASAHAALAQAVRSGQLDPHTADQLAHQLDDLTKGLGKNPEDAAHKIADLLHHLSDLDRSGRVSSAAVAQISAPLQQLATQLPADRGAQPPAGRGAQPPADRGEKEPPHGKGRGHD
jgi:hypothetical protein